MEIQSVSFYHQIPRILNTKEIPFWFSKSFESSQSESEMLSKDCQKEVEIQEKKEVEEEEGNGKDCHWGLVKNGLLQCRILVVFSECIRY